MKNSPKRNIRASVVYGLTAFLVAAALFFCLSTISRLNQRMNESAITNLRNTTQIMADALETSISSRFTALEVAGDIYAKGGNIDARQLASFCEIMQLNWMAVVDADGNGLDINQNTFQLSEHTGAANWDLRRQGHSSAYIGPYSGRMQITIWSPVYDNGKYAGAVIGNVIMSEYYSANVFTFYNGDGRTYVFDAADGSWVIKSFGTDGTAVRQNDIYSLLEASENAPGDISAFREAVESGRSGAALLKFNGKKSYLYFMPLPSSSNWYVTTVIARDTLLRESAEVQNAIQWVLAVLFAALALVAIVIANMAIRKTRKKETRYRQALFSNISANLDSAFLLYDKSGKRTAFVSDNVKRLLGIEREWLDEDAGHMFDWCKISPDDPQRQAFLDGRLAKPVVREALVENELGQNSRAIRLELIPADLGQELAVLTDITSDKQIQNSLIETMERAKAASNSKNDFLSAMSHDLRTPINGIVGMTAIAAAHIDDKARVSDCLEKISESTEHLLSLINEVLDMSQIESGKMELSREPFNIAQLLQDVLTVNYPGIQQKNHTVKVYIDMMEHEKVIGDPVRMTRIATNLISNAIKYTPSGGTITLKLKEEASVIHGYGCYVLEVRDNGIGMSPEFLGRLFEPFEREADVRVGKIQGTGLGMSIVKNIVEMMMGSIQVESEKDKGTTFYVTINLQLDGCGDAQSGQLAGLPVLVVDDDTDTCIAVTDILHSVGMIDEWTTNGEQAIDMVFARRQRGEDYIAVLLDWKMPGMDGVETCRRIRAKVGDKVPVIILTAYEWGQIEAQARQAGVDAFLSKPIYKSKLIQKMTEIVSGSNGGAARVRNQARIGEIAPGRRVLLAEDNDLNAEIATELLRMMGVEADRAQDGEEAVKKFRANAPGTYGMILMDIQMPKMNGYEATKTIRAMDRPDAVAIPIVAMTADAFKQDEQAAHEAGMNAHMAKPVSVDMLAMIIKRFLSDDPKEAGNENT